MKSETWKPAVSVPETQPATSWLVLCTAPEARIQQAVESVLAEVPREAIAFAGPQASPFARSHPSSFISWGKGPFTWDAAFSFRNAFRQSPPHNILLPLNNREGNGYTALRAFSLWAASGSVMEFPLNGPVRRLGWRHLLPRMSPELGWYSLVFGVLHLLRPLWRRWLRRYTPAVRSQPRPAMDPQVVQDHYSEKAPDVSVVIRTYNEEQFIGQTLERIRDQRDVNAEVIVIDSESTDATLDIAKSFPVRIYRITKASFNYSAALNLGARLSRAPYVVNLSAHALPASNEWLRGLIAPFKNDAQLCGTFGRERPIPGWSSPFEKKLLADMFRDEPVTRSNQFFFSNANSAIPRALLLETPFDETIDWGEDQEWVHRMQQRGYQTYYEPESAVYHSHNLSVRACFSRTLRFQRVLFARMYRDRVDEAHGYFKSQLPHRACSLRRFIRERRLVAPGWAYLYAPFCEFINFLGSDFARRELLERNSDKPPKESKIEKEISTRQETFASS